MSNIIDTLITDRTASDVSKIQTLAEKDISEMTSSELAEWLLGNTEDLYCVDGLLSASDRVLRCYDGVVKGSYNFKDLNRVGQAIAFLQNILHEYGYTISTTPKTDWSMTDIPNADELNLILTNLSICRAKLQLSSSVPAVPTTMERLDYTTANNIEKILKAVYDALMRIVEGMIVYCDDVFCGEV